MSKSIIELCKDKTVLQLGVLGDYKNYVKNIDNWEFSKITKNSKEAIGLDFNSEGIKTIKEKGFDNLIEGNAENFNLNRKFDIIYAGDIIEHLTDLKGFFESCKKHMTDESVLIITTPNPYSFPMLIRGLFSNTSSGIFEDHTLFIHERNLKKLSEIFDLKLIKTDYFSNIDRRNFFYRITSLLFIFLSKIKKTYNQSYWFELKLKD